MHVLALQTSSVFPYFAIVSNTDIDTGTESVDTFADTVADGCTWQYVVKKSTNLRSGTIKAVWEAAGNTVQYAESSTPDLGDTSDLTFTVDINSNSVRLLATAASDNWSVKAIRFMTT